MRHKALIASLLSCFIVLESTEVGLTQTQPSEQSAQVKLGEIRQSLYQTFQLPSHPADLNMPWMVLNLLAKQQMTRDFKSYKSVLLRNSTLANPVKFDDLVSRMKVDIAQIQVDQLKGAGLPSTVASDTDLGPSNVIVYQFSTALQTSTQAAFSQIKGFERSLDSIKGAAISKVLSDDASKEGLQTAQQAGDQVRTLLEQAKLGEEELNKLNASKDKILVCLKGDVQNALSAAPTELVAQRAYYEKLANIASSLPNEASTIQRTVSGLTIDNSVELLASLGHLKTTQKQFADHILSDATTLQQALQSGVSQLSGGWDKLMSAALQAPIANQELPPEVKRLAPFIQDFGNLKDMLGRGAPPSASDISGILFTSGIISRESGIGQAATAVSNIMQLKGDYSNAAGTVLDTVSKLNAAGVPIPGLKEAAPLLNSAASIVQAAGPLLALTGFGAGLTAFSALGGLGGGGGNDNSAQLAAIQQQLSVINAKLDRVLDKLDALDKKITAQHEQVMNALEALGFDIERTRELLANSLVHQTVRGPCRSAATPTDGARRSDDINECDRALQHLYAAADIPDALTLKANLITTSLQQSALDKFRQELGTRQMLVSLRSNLGCDSLVYPSQDIETLDRKLARYAESDGKASCGLLVLGAPLLEPGILQEYVSDEQNALNATALLGKDQALRWWHDHGTEVTARWTSHEIPILNQAVAQQAIVSGDILLPTFAKFLDDGSELEKVKQVWNAQGVFAENVVRYWIWTRLRDETWIRTLYSFAWNSQSDEYWHRLLCQNQADCGVKNGIQFTQETVKTVREDGSEGDEALWFVTFGSLQKVPMPKPSEMYTLQLRWPATLTSIVGTRDRLLSASGGIEFVNQLWRPQESNRAKDVLEGLAVTNSK